ncbi:hypothetical protein Poli38472_005588 [Pythium oligandrum]|uniref:Outer kinetochore protein DAD4 n=1 Tax=Pythium oligandrum TaxID=41045 RepID=A0A8K1FGN8_PYTOL|nr:hypothetical protein Poli38472_005588 [Pythium oligandrum]|eukprot:TMW62970.1 hypothetical protein Poli38472_005588 [Pythium oligandrum]
MLCSKHKHLLQPIFTMQSKAQEKCLGKAFWTKQRQKRPKLLAGRDSVPDLAKPQTIASHVATSNDTPKAPALPPKQAWTEIQVSTSKPTATEKLAAKQKQHEQEVLEAWITTQTQVQPLVQLYFEAYAEKHTVDTNLRTYLASGKGKSQSPEDVQTLTDLRYQAAVCDKKYNVAKAKLHEVWDAEEQAETEKRHHAVRGVVHGVSSKTLHKQTGKQSAQSVIGSYMDKKLDAATQEIHQVFQQRWETLDKAAQYVTTTTTARDKPSLRPSVPNGTNRVVPVLQETETWTEHFDTHPHEEKQKALLQRIAGSVTRLNDVLKEINFQIEKSEPLREDLALTCQVWKGYESRVQLHCNAVASTTNGHGKR